MQAPSLHEATARAWRAEEHRLAEEGKLAIIRKEDQLAEKHRLLRIKEIKQRGYFLSSNQNNAIEEDLSGIKVIYIYLNRIRPLSGSESKGSCLLVKKTIGVVRRGRPGIELAWRHLHAMRLLSKQRRLKRRRTIG